jgi:protein-S-isoprenylcysteine O-methyltransferase Ste14
MEGHAMTKETSSQAAPTSGPKAVLSFAMIALTMAVLLFASAGTFDWPMGWAYIVLTVALTLGSRVLMLRLHPDLVAERARYDSRQGAQEWDKKILPIVGVFGPLAMLILAGLDRRFAWSPQMGNALPITALLLTALGAIFSTWAMLANRFFSAIVRIQRDRGQTVISDGPYRFVRHPGYTGGIVANICGPLALGSLAALLAGLVIVGLTIYRTAREDKMLHDELDGYKAYAQRVRYRLLPGVW